MTFTTRKVTLPHATAFGKWIYKPAAHRAGYQKLLALKALDIDRYHRRMGMVYGAEKGLIGLMANPQTKIMANAYTDGINQYIHSLAP